MKKLSILLLPLFFLSCGKFENLFLEHNSFPYVVDSTFIASLNFEDFEQLSGEHLKVLYESVKQLDNNSNENVIHAIIEMDSIGSENISKEDMMNKYWQLQYSSVFALHKLNLKSGIVAYTWYLSFSDGNQGPEIIMTTLYKDDKPYSCFQLAKLYSYSDSPAWNSGKEEGIINEDGKVTVKSYEEYGEYSEEGEDFHKSSHSVKEFSVETGDIEIIKEETIRSDSDDNSQEDTKDTVINLEDYDAITVGNGLKLRSEASSNSEIVTEYNTGELVKILNKTNSREILTEGDMCDSYGYYWYKIKDTKGTEGWAYGKFIYEISKPKNEDKIYYKSYQLEGKEYIFAYAYDLSYGPSDNEGLTGCDMFYLPFFYEKGNKVMPIFYDKEEFPAGDLGWKSALFDGELLFLVLSSEGGSDDIEEINSVFWEGNDSFELIVSHSYQDGGSRSKIYISVFYNIKVTGYEHEELSY